MDNFKQRLLEEENRAFVGWDFSSLKGRMEEEDLPWDYKDIVINKLDDSMNLLDMGTGGGEFLLTLNHPYSNTTITESYEPNIELCKKKLSPLGISVVKVEDDAVLPFDNDSFDIVINRHESYDVNEVKRILKSKGLFITQQVGGKNNYNISKSIIPDYLPETIDFNLKNEVRKFEVAGFNIIFKDEFYPYVRFHDLGAFVYFAKIIEWEFPGFSVEKHYDKLLEMQMTIETNGYVDGDEHRFIIVARNEK